MAQAESGAAQDVSLNEFLAGIKMQQHGTLLEELGYDDVGDFGQYSDVDLERMRAALTSNSMPAGHIDKFVRAIVKQRPPAAPPAAAAALVPSPAPLPADRVSAGDRPANVVGGGGGGGGEAADGSGESTAIVQHTAEEIGRAAKQLYTEGHAKKVKPPSPSFSILLHHPPSPSEPRLARR